LVDWVRWSVVGFGLVWFGLVRFGPVVFGWLVGGLVGWLAGFGWVRRGWVVSPGRGPAHDLFPWPMLGDISLERSASVGI